MLNVGVDLGSTAIKVVICRGEEILWKGRTPTVPRQEKEAQRLIDQGLSALGLGPETEYQAVSTGYGKRLFTSARLNVDELGANALGLYHLSGGKARMGINVGGQDLKVLHIGPSGRIVDFKMNDKCAAGTGRFFEQAARILDTPLEDFGELGTAARGEVEISSTCVVFAESEIVSLLAEGVAREEIIRGLCFSVARRIAALAAGGTGPVYLDGGPAQNRCLVEALSIELDTEVLVLDAPQYTVALGAHQWALMGAV